MTIGHLVNERKGKYRIVRHHGDYEEIGQRTKHRDCGGNRCGAIIPILNRILSPQNFEYQIADNNAIDKSNGGNNERL